VKLHILTACTRPWNLPRIADSIYAFQRENVEVHWHIGHDDEPAVGGQRIKNRLLDDITNGWVYVLDDDTLMHPELLYRLPDLCRRCDVVLFAQVRGELVHNPQLLRGCIDVGQAVIRRSTIGKTRIPDFYDGDGWFLEAVCGKARNVKYLNQPLSFYNLLEGEPDARSTQRPTAAVAPV
jgi:hypothetical protein